VSAVIFNKVMRFTNYKSNILIVLGVLWNAIFLVNDFLCYFWINSYHKAYERLSDQAVSYAHLIASHDRYGFTLAETLLKGMIDHLREEDFNGIMAPERRFEVMGDLKRYRERLPGIASFTLIGPDGIRRIGVVGKDGADLSYRGYFKALRNGQDLYISDAEEGLASGRPGIHIARRFSGANGRFCGVVVLDLAVENIFFPFYESLNLGKNFGASLRDSKRTLIRYPKNYVDQPGRKEDGTVGNWNALRLNKGVFIEIDPFDGLKKMTAYEQLEGTTLFASASLPVDEAVEGPNRAAWQTFLAALASILGGIAATIAIVRTRGLEEARDEAIKAGVERRKLIQKVDSAVEDERKSIAIEIHDELNAALVAARLNSQRILDLTAGAVPSPGREEIRERAESTIKLTTALYSSARNIVRRLRPEVLDMLGLQGAVEEMLHCYDVSHSNCRFEFNPRGDFSKLEDGPAIAAYRLVQEALSNIIKHAAASKVSVSLFVDDEENGLHITITDNGIGFDPGTINAGIGMIGMRERVYAFNGQMEI
jgi:signal transduction histidine kinase